MLAQVRKDNEKIQEESAAVPNQATVPADGSQIFWSEMSKVVQTAVATAVACRCEDKFCARVVIQRPSSRIAADRFEIRTKIV